jgi:ribose 5-phosphate isomerase B
MRVAVAADHRGFELKEHVKRWLTAHGHEVTDFGTDSAESVDYPDYGFAASEAVTDGKADAAVLACDTGIGMCITANKVPGIRAALVDDPKHAATSRSHNNANVLCLAGDRIRETELNPILQAWFSTGFEGGRHARRLGKIADKERGGK